jgi:hypothetical protein
MSKRKWSKTSYEIGFTACTWGEVWVSWVQNATSGAFGNGVHPSKEG